MIYQKIVNIMEELVPIGKIKREEITSIMQPLLAKYKLVIKPSEVIDYKHINQEASFKLKYEIVDAEDSELQSINLEVPGGGCDQESKGRATYMALTGAYRQALQQLFSIQIYDELYQGNVFNYENSSENVFPEIHEFKDDKENNVEQIRTVPTTNIKAETVVEKRTIIEPAEITEDYLENEFANYFSGGEVA